MFEIDVTIAGGGVVGCAVAAACARKGWSVVLLEQEAGLGRATTSRNSQVSHGGMYYPAGSLKARYCVAGRRMLKEFCLDHGVGYQECGKLIVATSADQLGELERLHALGTENGVEDLRLLDAGELSRLEPGIDGVAALHSPRTGILDAEGVAKAFARVAVGGGAQVMTGARLAGLERAPSGWLVSVESGAVERESWRHGSRCVVNAAGLWADRVAALAGIDPVARNWSLHLSRGNYFAVDPRHTGKVGHLVYPVPPADGSTLGAHVCLDLGGRMRLGPDYELLAGDPRPADGRFGLDADLDYRVDPARAAEFFAGARTFLPWLEIEDLTPDMCGLRPKLCLHGFRDFEVSRESDPDLVGLINLVGIDSPGLTSSPALAEAVAGLAAEILA
ncbi:FAD-dependent oxidoreductase [bacterium CG_4_9_14_3_um_filter_65_15]|nr:MAG: FAD-dependent oxidoreductase [bacterium CG_4_9_14_3_um_filter_65_15]